MTAAALPFSETTMPDIGAVSSVAAADDTEQRGYVYFPNLLGRHQLTNLDLKETRRRSQWLCLNTSARVLRALAHNVGSCSIHPATTDEDFNAAVAAWWEETYCVEGNYDMSGKYSAESFLSNCLYQTWRDGDCLALHITKRNGEPSVAAIEANRIDQPWNWTGPNEWQDGVLTNAYYKRLAYSIRVDPPGYWSNGAFNPQYVTVGAGNTFFFREDETQASTRGTPALIHAVADLLDEREIHNSIMSITKAHALIGIAIERESGVSASASIPLPGARVKETVSPSVPNSANVKASPGVRTIAEVIGAGGGVNLDPGAKAKLLQMTGDHPNETEIKNGIYRKLALGLGLPVQTFILLEELTGPGVRYVLRQTQKWRQRWLKSMKTFQSTDYTRRVAWAMSTGRLPKCKDPVFARHYFIEPAAVTIDDGRTASAGVMELGAGITNLAQIYGEKGESWKPETTQSIDEIAFIEEYCKKKGVDPTIYYNRQAGALTIAQAQMQIEAAEINAKNNDGKTKAA